MTDCKRAAIIGFFSIFFSVAAMAQEICDNGIDDDGDGLIDCFDPDCSGSGSCSDFFFGNPILCENDPSVTNFDIALQWGSPNESSHNKSSVTVGDLNNDGIPEVIVTNHLENTINILNGQNGDWLYSLDPGFEPENIVAVGNINDDDCGEVFFTGRRGSNSIGNIVEAWNCDLTTRLWSTRSNLDRAGNPALADFNQDGVVEFYHANEIINAETGAIIVPGTGQWDTETMYGSVAVDIFPDSFCADCSGLELVDGPWIYAVNIAAGTKTLIKQLDDILPSGQRFLPKRWSWGDGTSFAFTSVADFDTDGDMDVFFSGALGTSTNDQTTIFFWDPVEDQFQTYADVSNNFERGTGRINIADMDNDGNLNISYVSNQKLYCLDENMDPLWIKGIVEGSSGFTGCSLFDFDGDGSGEVIYRSEGTLHIIDGTDGSTRNSIYCQSRTWFEYPIVADVDGDGASELIVTCSTSDALAFDPYSGSRNSHVRVYEAANGERWQPSRSVWNQHGYFAVNVNDDLTIPIQQQDHTIAFSDGGCPEAGIVGEVRSLNSFLNQAPFLNQDGCAEYSQPDFSIGDNITFSAPTCPDTEFSVSFLLSNVGDLDLSGNLPITFYSGDPTVAGSVKLNTIVQPLVDFNPGDQLVVTGTVQGPGGDFELFISINDVGTQNPPIDPDAQVAITECETVNNLASVSIVSEPFNLSVSKISDNNKCDDALPDNGSARAFYLGDIPSMVEVAWLEDFEDLTVGDESDNGATAWSKTHSLANDSRISEVSDFFSGNSFFVNNSDEEVVWTSQSIDISSYVSVDITMDLLSDGGLETSEDYVQVFYILDGGTAVQMNNGSQVGDFSYAQATASGLTGSTLTIRARIFNTGGSERYAIDNIRVVGMTPPETGEFTDDFTFRWYNQNDFSTVLFTGSEFPTMAEGTYSVIGFSNLGNCFSDTASIQIDRIRIDPIGIAFESNEPINCLMPNGEITAGAIDVNDYDNDGLTTDTVTIGYSFVLFNGSFRTDDDIVGTGSIIGNLEAGDYEYVITDLQSGCDVTQQVSLRSPNILPTIVFDSKVDVTSCADLNTGSATVSSPDDVTFLWYDGGTVRATEDFTGPTYSGIPPGEYTVVAQDNNTGCKSLPLVIEIEDLTGTPEAVATAVSPNTSCEAGTGSATATGDTGSGPSVAGFDFEWYAGLFTSEVANNRLPGALAGVNISADGATASNLPDGFYTVVVTETATGCFDIDTVEVRANFEIPEFTFRTPVDTEDAVVIGGNGYVEIPQTLAGLTSFTISYWADFTPDNYSADERTFSSGATGENQVLLWSDNHDGLAFVVDGVAGSRGRINSAYSATGWTQVVGTYDASTGDMFMYANGVQIGSTTYNGGAVRDTGNPMFIGRDNNPNYGKFEGTLDEVRIYNIALSPEDIVEQMCRELTGSEAGLIAYYDFNNVTGDTDGTIIPDVSGNGNDGTLREPDASSSISTVTADIECPITTIDANTSCDASNPNGIIDVSNDITPAGGDYTFSLYEGFSTATLLESNSTGIFTGYAGGFYTLSAEDNTTGCITSPSVVSLPDIPDNPNIATVVVDDQGCNSAGLGEILVTASSNTTRNGSIVEPASYTFEIFNGANTTDLRQTESITDGATGFNFTGLADGVYRIRVTNDDLTCFSVLDVNVGSNEILPVIDASFTNVNASCDPANPSGQMIVQFTGDPADFTFRWYTGDVVDENQRIAGESGSTLSGLAAGNYTVVMVSNLTECVSLPATETISDQPLFPDITIETVNDLTNCDGSNGSLRAYVIDPDNPSVELDEDDGYTFQWYTGNTVTAGNEVSNADGGNTSTIINQGAGEYIVEVTFTSFSCSNTEVSTINDATVLPVLTLANTASTENTICDPGSSGSYDGTATVNALTIDGTTVNLPNADYTFRWYQGTDVTGTLLGETSNILSQRQDGSYTVVARNTVTGCESSPITITIDPLFVFPDVTLIDTDDNIICDPTLTPTGEITIRPTVGNITDYNFTWFSGQTTDPTENVLDDGASVTVTSTDNIVSNIAGGTYRVLVENIATGCSETFDFTINDTPTTPEIDGPNSEVNDNTLCSLPGDGSIIAALNLAGIEINGVDNDQIWQNISSCNTVVLDDATTIGTNGFQLTTATNNQFGRIWLGDTVDLSQPLRLDFRLYLGDKDANGADGIALTFHRDPRGYDARGGVGQDLGVGDTRGANTIPQVTPSFSVEFDDFQNGDIDDPAFDHTNLFFNGDIDVQITPPVQIADGLDNVENGDTLDVTFVIRQIGGEQNLRLFVNESMRFEYTGDIVNDIFGGATDVIAGFTSSTGGSNNDQAVFIEPFLDRFEFDWYDGSSVDAANIRSEKDPFLCGLSGGQYTLVVTDNTTGCVSAPFTYQVEDTGAVPNFTLDATNSINNGVCDPALATTDNNGRITITPEDGSDPSDYTYEWFDGDNTSAPGITGAITNVLDEIDGGTYTVRITQTSNSCDEIFQFSIIDETTDPVLPVAAANTTDLTVCLGGTGYPNGTISVTDASIVGSGPYTYRYYIGTSVDPDSLIDDDDNIFLQIDPLSSTVGVTVSGSSTDNISGLTSGQYTVVAISTVSGCISNPVTVTVDEVQSAPVFDVDAIGAGSENNAVCDITLAGGPTEYSGQISITQGTGSSPGPFSFQWYTGSGTSSPITGETGQVLANIQGGTYTVMITDDITNCTTLVEATIIDDTNDPEIPDVTADVDIQDVSLCNGADGFPNGEIDVIEANITSGGPFGSGTYVFRYYFGSSVDPDSLITDGTSVFAQQGTTPPATGTVSTVNGANTDNITGLGVGTYTIVAIEDNTGCASDPVTVNIGESQSAPVFTVASIGAGSENNAVCDITLADGPTEYSGQISITQGTGSSPGPFSFQWYTGSGTSSPIGGETGQVLANIEGGTYTVMITDDITNCTALVEATIINETNDPAIPNVTTDVDIEDVSLCSGANGFPNGEIDVVEANITSGGAFGSGTYVFRYYFGSTVDPDSLITDGTSVFAQQGTTPPATGTVSTVMGASTDNITGLGTGVYTVVAIEDNTGCSSDPVTVTIGESQNAPVFTVDAIGAGSENNAVCDITIAGGPTEYSGQISVTQGVGSSAGPFSFQWYTGSGTSAPISGETGQVLANIQGGTYTVMITDDVTNCTTLIEATIVDDTNDPIIPDVTTDVDVQDVSLCSGANGFPDGGIEVVEANLTSGGAFGSGSYIYRYYFGSSVDADSLITNGTSVFAQKGTNAPSTGTVSVVQGAGTENITGLGTGTYTVVAIEDNTGCISNPVTVVVGEDQSAPVFTIDAIGSGSENNSVCDISITGGPTEYDGQISISQATGSSPGPFSFQWYTGSGTSASIAGETSQILDNIQGGTYTVMITDNTTNCTALLEATITDDTNDPSIGDLTAGVLETNVSNCTGLANLYPDGAITIVETEITGTGPYSYEYYFGLSAVPADRITDGTSIFDQNPDITGPADARVISGSATSTILGLNGGEYLVVIVDRGTGCKSDPIPVTIEEDVAPLELEISGDNALTFNNPVCDDGLAGGPTTFGGQITVVRTDGDPDLSDFTFEWYTGTNLISANELSNTDNVLEGIEGGTVVSLMIVCSNSSVQFVDMLVITTV
ncbi:MAG: LamG-like jellyroll fold domain-containing protein [Bacteroidota bacterium]